MKNVFRLVVAGSALALATITGCNSDQHPEYSAGVKYGLRIDPILMTTSNDLGAERFDPDRPGVFPVMTFTDVLKPESPLYPKSQSIVDKEVLRDPTKVPAKERQELETALTAIFGTPAMPKVDAKAAGLDDDTVSILKLDDKTLAMGSTRYRVHCLHCHGVPGDGRGPTARWINPHPRDFRSGKFKFQSVNQLETSRPPSRRDLLRTLRSGIEGTAMPSFNLLTDAELEALVSYVIHLSVRGKVEMDVIKGSFDWKKDTRILEWSGIDPGTGDPISVLQAVKDFTKLTLHNTEQTDEKRRADWRIAQQPSAAIPVAKYPYSENDTEALKASVQRGRMLFTAKPSDEFRKEYHKRRGPELHQRLQEDANKRGKTLSEKDLNQQVANALNGYLTTGCVSCHVDFGRQAKFRYDDWATLVRPNNFTVGVFRGGRRPVDLYYRIHSGINGSNMTPFGSSFQGQDIWDLVNFVSSLSYPLMRKELEVNID